MPLADAGSSGSLQEFIQGPVKASRRPELSALPAIQPPPAALPQTYEAPTAMSGYNLSGGNGAAVSSGYNLSGNALGSPKVPNPADTEKAETAYERALRARAIGADVQGPHLPGHGVGTGEVQRMTQEKYDALDPQQRAAVDFNTMLVQATRKDLKHQDDYDPNSQERSTYDAAIEKMFGDQARDSETYAPETLALLRQIGYHDESSDLDDFLNLNTAITKKDLKGLPYDTSPLAVGNLVSDLGSTDPDQIRTNQSRDLAAKTGTLEESLAQGGQLLQSVTATAKLDRNDMLANEMIGMGGIANTPHTPLGYGPTNLTPTGEPADLNTFFQQAYTQLSQKKDGLTLEEVRKQMDALPDQGAFAAFLDYADSRSGNAERFDVSLGSDPGVKYRTPEQFRQLLGLDE